MAQTLMENDAEKIVRAVVEKAIGGDLVAAKIVIDRLIPPARERAVTVSLPDISTAEGIDAAQREILLAVGAGRLMPAEATALSSIVEARRRAFETVTLARLVKEIEVANKIGGTQ